MKRGLKAKMTPEIQASVQRYNLFPDEKGTERASPQIEFRVISVTTYSPMKRGLKAALSLSLTAQSQRYNLFPDEKGTERD